MATTTEDPIYTAKGAIKNPEPRRLKFEASPDGERVPTMPSASIAPRVFDTVKVFSATKHRERELLGETITDWLRVHPEIEIIDKIVLQSSDNEFHCISITLFGKQK